MSEIPQAAIDAAAEALAAHRWKSMGIDSVECECGQIIVGQPIVTGPSFDPDGPGYETANFPADEAFRRHLGAAILEAAAPLITSHRETATAQVIARAERERIRQLAAEHDAKAAKCSAGVAPQPSRPCACRTANPAFPFADLLTEG